MLILEIFSHKVLNIQSLFVPLHKFFDILTLKYNIAVEV